MYAPERYELQPFPAAHNGGNLTSLSAASSGNLAGISGLIANNNTKKMVESSSTSALNRIRK